MTNKYARTCGQYQDGYCMRDATNSYRIGHRVDDSDASTFFCRSCRGEGDTTDPGLKPGSKFMEEKEKTVQTEQIAL